MRETTDLLFKEFMSFVLLSEQAAIIAPHTHTHTHTISLFGFVMELQQCFSTAGQRPGTGPLHQLYRAARGLRKLQYATRFH